MPRVTVTIIVTRYIRDLSHVTRDTRDTRDATAPCDVMFTNINLP